MVDNPQPDKEHHADHSSQQPASRNASGRERQGADVWSGSGHKNVSNCKRELKSNVQTPKPVYRCPCF